MKETIQDLKTRRSVKKYRPDQITKNELVQVLEAGMNAPSGMGRQSAVMAVVQDPETLKKLSSLNASIMGVSSDPFYGAPTVIVVLADSTVPTYREDGSLVMGNLLNAAHALGLGSCWIHRAKEGHGHPGRAGAFEEVGAGQPLCGHRKLHPRLWRRA